MKKMTAAIITLIFILISATLFIETFSGKAYAEYPEPEKYLVKKLDNLWDISERKLADPFLWPRLWNVNSHIENPDLIYPGTWLIIPSREELLAMPMPKNMPLSILKRKALHPMPKLVFEFPEDAINKYIVNKETFIKSGWIEPEFPGIGKLLFSEKGSMLIDSNDIVYIETSGSSEIGSTYFIIKSVKKVRHPVTEDKMGHQITISGILEIIGSDDNVLKARVKTTFDDISIGNGLLPFNEMDPPMVIDEPRTPSISGYIVESHINSTISSKGDIIFLDKGSNDGVEVGDLFKAISEKPVKRTVGKIQVIKVKPATSTAIILESAREEISLGMSWGQ
ncbi:MAG: LysM peptidoglycan-binding domain-containing protein [Nitrospira sp.]|nr:LysM peptidoglycan-binding domain-containing protein [Nitrospira sp.]